MSAPTRLPLVGADDVGGGSAHVAHIVGNTPIAWVDTPFTTDGRGFWAKLEGANPGWAMALSSYAGGGWSVGAVGTVAGWLARTREEATN